MKDQLMVALSELGERSYQGLTPPPDLASSALSRWRRRRRFQAVGIGLAAVLTAGLTVGGLELATEGSSSTMAVDSHSERAPCATPPGSLVDALRWPCPTGPVTPYDRKQFNNPQTFAGTGVQDGWQVRTLAFGALPHSRPGSTIVVGEAWKPGTSQTRIYIDYAAPAKYMRHAGVAASADAPIPQVNRAGPLPSGRPALILADPPRLGRPSSNACRQLAGSRPEPHHGYVAGCTDFAVVRADIAAIQPAHNGAEAGPPIPVRGGIAGLDDPKATRAGWTIEALDAQGHTVDVIPWTPTM